MTADIYLIEASGETSGPHSLQEVVLKLEAGDILPSFYAFTEGMPDWRAVGEAMVWACRSVAADMRSILDQQTSWIISGQTTFPVARLALRDALRKMTGTYGLEQLECILAASVDHRRFFDHRLEHFAPGALEAFPAWELFFSYDLAFPRDWSAAWTKAGGTIHQGKMVALKASPVWSALSDFGTPFPPFSFDTAVYVRDVDWTAASLLGLRLEKQTVPALDYRTLF